MFWGCFHSNTEGPGFFLRKKVGAQYQGLLTGNTQWLTDLGCSKGDLTELLFMQDGAPSYAAKETRQLLSDYAINDID
jgi:hypothetical protein